MLGLLFVPSRPGEVPAVHERLLDHALRLGKTMKHWPRAWKVRLIVAANPDWQDLYDQLGR
jgi:predicted GIY-YIG superfamily endonuclease